MSLPGSRLRERCRTGWSGNPTVYGRRLHALDPRRRGLYRVVSRNWLGTLTSPKESSTQVESPSSSRLRPKGCSSWPTSGPPRRCPAALRCEDRDRVHALAERRAHPAAFCHQRQRAADAQPLYPRVLGRYGPVRSPRHPNRSGVDQEPVRPPSEWPHLGEDPRLGHPGRRVRRGSPEIQRDPVARRDRVRHP